MNLLVELAASQRGAARSRLLGALLQAGAEDTKRVSTVRESGVALEALPDGGGARLTIITTNPAHAGRLAELVAEWSAK